MNYELFMDICHLSAAIFAVIGSPVCIIWLVIWLVRRCIAIDRRDKEKKKNES